MISLLRSHPVLVYFALVFAISWGGILIAAGPSGIFSSKADPLILNQFIYLAALAGPCVAGILMTFVIGGKAGLRDLLSRSLRWRVDVRWYLIALLTAPILMAAIIFVLSLTSPAFVPAIVTTDNRTGLVMSGLVMGLVVCVFEELGWTGFATPELRKRYGFLTTGIMIGLPWGAWHYPLFSGSASASGSIPPALYIAVLLFSFLIPYRILMVWVYDRTSVLVVMLMHAPLAAGQLILLPSVITGERAVVFDLVFAAALWVVVAAVYMATRQSGRGQSLFSIETARPQS
jgi:uncharacterized protein